jgi:hypothetical protein
MTRVMKLAVGGGILSAATLAGATILLHTLLPSARITPLVARELSQKSGFDIHIDTATVGVFHGLSLTGVTTARRAGGPPFLTIARVVAYPSLSALIRGKIIFRRIALLTPTVDASLDAVARIPMGLLASTPIADITVKDGRFIGQTNDRRLSLSLEGISARVRAHRDGTRTVAASGRSQMTWKERLPWGCSFTADARIDPQGLGRIELLSFIVTADGAALEARGIFNNRTTPEADVTVTMNPIEARALVPFIDLSPVTAGVRAEGVVTIRGSTSAVVASGDIDVFLPGVALNGTGKFHWERSGDTLFAYLPRALRLRPAGMTPAVHDLLTNIAGTPPETADVWCRGDEAVPLDATTPDVALRRILAAAVNAKN